MACECSKFFQHILAPGIGVELWKIFLEAIAQALKLGFPVIIVDVHLVLCVIRGPCPEHFFNELRSSVNVIF